MSGLISGDVWTILDERGGPALSFTSFISLDYRNEGDALSYPVEQGGFINYNKSQKPLGINVTIGVQGSEADFEQAMLRLEEYRREAVKLSVSTPSRVYSNLTLTGVSNSRKQDVGAGMLLADLTFIEVCEPGRKSGSIISRPKNPTSASVVNVGKTQLRAGREFPLLSRVQGVLEAAAQKIDPILKTAETVGSSAGPIINRIR